MSDDTKAMVSKEETFDRLDIRLGQVIDVQVEPSAPKRAYRLTVDFGKFGKRTSIGRFTGQSSGRIVLARQRDTNEGGRSKHASEPRKEQELMNQTPSIQDSHAAGCCADVFETKSPATTVTETQQAFGAMMRSVQAAGVLDARTKELLLFGMVLQSRCAPCFDAHYAKAQELGITQAELDEVAWCAIAMGGAPVRMFYQECLRRVSRT